MIEVQERGRILVVEDELVIARDLAETLEALGYMVSDTVPTGELAIDAARTQQPDAIVMDIRLAGEVDGIDAARQICAERDTAIVYLTAHADDDTLQRAKTTEPLSYLVKPFRGAELRCAIEIAIHNHDLRRKQRERERWLSSLLRSLSVGVIATDTQENVALVNPSAETLTGWLQDDAAGRTLDDVLGVNALHGTATENPVRTAMEDRRIVTLPPDAELVARTGATVPIGDSASPIIDPQGNVLGGVIVLCDPGAQRFAHTHALQRLADLERRLPELHCELDAAYEDIRSLDHSFAVHLRAPLRRIDAFGRLLLEEHAAQLEPDGLAHLLHVRTATHHLAALLDGLLELSRIAGQPLQHRPVDLSAIARRIAAELQSRLPGPPPAVHITPHIVVDGDPRLLRVAIEHLLENAWKFTAHQAAPRIELGAVYERDERVIFVRDNGIGFDAQAADGLFAPFRRFHAPGEFGGAGLGLALVHRIVRRHGGRVWVRSQPGQGATFYLTLRGPRTPVS